LRLLKCVDYAQAFASNSGVIGTSRACRPTVEVLTY
jgi:hypothetical protein